MANFYEIASGADAATRADSVTRRQDPLGALREIFGTDRRAAGAMNQQSAAEAYMNAGNAGSMGPSAFPSTPVVTQPTGQPDVASALETYFGTFNRGEVDPVYPTIPRPVSGSNTVATDLLETVQRALQTGKTRTQEMADMYGEYAEGRGQADAQAFDQSYFKDAYSRARSVWEQPYLDQQAEIRSKYQDRVAELENELSGYRGGLADINAAYSSYADDADAILGEAAAVEAEALGESAVEETVHETYDDFDGEMQSMLRKIDGNGNQALAKAMSQEVRRTEEMVTDGLRSDLTTQSELHDLAGAQAQALANMAWKDDAYSAERSRFELDLQINQAINAKGDEIADTRSQMNDALAASQAAMGEFQMSSDELWQAGLNDFARSRGLSDVEIADMQGIWQGVMQNPDAAGNYGVFKQGVMTEVHRQNLASLGYLGRVDALEAQFAADGNVAGMAALDAMYSATSYDDFANEFAKFARGSGMAIPIDKEGMSASTDAMYQSMLDLWGHHKDFTANYESYQQTEQQKAAAVTSSKGSQAPNNWDSRYQPAYRHRREVWAPQFAQKFQARFGSKQSNGKSTVGGLGYIRPPGRGANNSDHQSGGALDLYANTEAERLQIASWARSQPGVSMVIYEGNSDHEGHHVHVSLQLGYGFGD